MGKRTNIVVFFTDQQRWDSCGCYGNPMRLTPRLDEMAERGTRMENAFTTQPVCAPARACLMTGLHGTQHGTWRNGIPLDKGLPTLAKAYRSAGGWAGYIGKWHLGGAGTNGQTLADETPIPPANRGGWDDLWIAADTLEFVSHPYRLRLYDGNHNLVERKGYRVDAQTDLVLEALEERARDREKPFCLFVSYLEPHFQNDLDLFVGPRGLAERYAEKLWVPDDLKALGGSTALHLPGYWSIIRSLDENLGRVLDFLAKSGLDNETVVLFTTDHGCHFKTRNGEYKRSCHDSSIRIPAVLQGPGFDDGGSILNLVSLLDLHATLRDAGGLPPAPRSEGRSIRPLLSNRKMEWRDEVFVQVSESQVGRALRTPRWTYGVTARGLDGWRVSTSSLYADEYLYDLDRDPAQLRNLIGSGALPPVRDELAARVLARLQEAGEPLATLSP